MGEAPYCPRHERYIRNMFTGEYIWRTKRSTYIRIRVSKYDRQRCPRGKAENPPRHRKRNIKHD